MGEFLPELNKPRVGSIAILINDSIFVFGGGLKSIEIMDINIKK